MSEENQIIARKEIKETLKLCNLWCRIMGVSITDDIPKTFYGKLQRLLVLTIAGTLCFLLTITENAFVVVQLSNAVSIEEFAGSYLHCAGYAAISFGKFLTLWYKRDTFRKLVRELEEIWPVSIDGGESDIKKDSISGLMYRQYLYIFFNLVGDMVYNITPIAVPIYKHLRGEPWSVGYVWPSSYPFDKTKPVAHTIVYIYEVFAGMTTVFSMLGTDLLFITMSSHISMLLRLLQEQIRNLGSLSDNDDKTLKDIHTEVEQLVKIHQRLISYINDLEDAFALINLINVLLSSVNICFVTFSIVIIDLWMELSNKLYLGAVLSQMGVICWYADVISEASAGVADAVYESSWYNCNTRSRRALLIMLQRSQKPLYFTALKFSNITLITYSSILKTSYSYFTLLYTNYSRNKEQS